MKTLQTSQPTRLAAALAIAAGLLTGALMTSMPSDPAHPQRDAANMQIDPSIPTLTIVARRLTAAEKRQTALTDRLASQDGVVTVGNDANRSNQANPASAQPTTF